MGRVAKQAPSDVERAMTAVIEERRQAAGMTQAQLARAAGVSQPHVSRILSGARSATVTELIGLCAALGISLSELAAEAGDR